MGVLPMVCCFFLLLHNNSYTDDNKDTAGIFMGRMPMLHTNVHC
jgi:hypothetical protein